MCAGHQIDILHVIDLTDYINQSDIIQLSLSRCNSMKKISSILATLPLITTACGGGGGENERYDENIQSFDLSTSKGTYSNGNIQTVTTSSGKPFIFDKSTALVTSDSKLAILTSDFKAFFLDPDTKTGKYFKAFTYIDTVDFNISKKDNVLTVTFSNPEREINGSLSFNSTSAYSIPSETIDLTGTWTDDNLDDYFYPNHETWSFTILADNSFTAINANSCEISNGLLSPINTLANEYTVTMDVSNCDKFNGTHTGVAFVETIDSPNDRIVIITNNGSNLSSRTLGIKPVRD